MDIAAHDAFNQSGSYKRFRLAVSQPANDQGAGTQLDSFVRHDVAIDDAADHTNLDVDVGINSCRCVNDEGSFVREYFTRDMAVDAEHVFKAQLAIQFRHVRSDVARPLFDCHGAARRAQVSRDYSINRE